MRDISIVVVGDTWCNRDEVLDQIMQCTAKDHVKLVVNTEGPSLRALGIVDTIQNALRSVGIDDDRVWIDRWHNMVEIIPWCRAYQPKISHFFWMSDRYRDTKPLDLSCDHVFGLFIGRLTADRAVILFECYHELGEQLLASLMQNTCTVTNFDLDLVKWLDPQQIQRVIGWYQQTPISSITGHSVRDQYRPEINTNAELISHYNRFRIEIVCETYCAGDAFFPTEKTIRPLSQGKPLLVFGPRAFLKRLKDLGFRTWHGIWDESYDDLSGPDRWRAIKKIIKDILTNRLDLDPDLAVIAQHNIKQLQHTIEQHRPS